MNAFKVTRRLVSATLIVLTLNVLLAGFSPSYASTELAYEDGVRQGNEQLYTVNAAVEFVLSDFGISGTWSVKQVAVRAGYRWGTAGSDAGGRLFWLRIWDQSLNTLFEKQYRYDTFTGSSTGENTDWRTIDFGTSVTVQNKFYVIVFAGEWDQSTGAALFIQYSTYGTMSGHSYEASTSYGNYVHTRHTNLNWFIRAQGESSSTPMYKITFATKKLPSVLVTYYLNGASHGPGTSPWSYTEDLPAQSSIQFDVSPKEYTSGSTTYRFDHWENSAGQTISSPQTVTRTDTFTAVYSSQSSTRAPTLGGNCYIYPTRVSTGQYFTAYYSITNPNSYPMNVGLGCSIRPVGTSGDGISDRANDKVLSVSPGTTWYSRTFGIQSDLQPGSYEWVLAIWSGSPGGSTWYGSTGWQRGLEIEQGTNPVILSVSDMKVDQLKYAADDIVTFLFTVSNVGEVTVVFRSAVKVKEPDGNVIAWTMQRDYSLDPGENTMISFSVVREGGWKIGQNAWGVVLGGPPPEYSNIYTDSGYVATFNIAGALPESVSASIVDASVSPGEYAAGSSVTASVTFVNTGNVDWNFYVGYSVQDPNGKWWDAPYAQRQVLKGHTATVILAWTVPNDAPSGPYRAGVAVWKSESGGLLDDRLDVKYFSNAFTVKPSSQPEQNPTLGGNSYIDPTSVNAGESFTAYFYITNPNSDPMNVGLGCSIRPSGTSGDGFSDPADDIIVSVHPGKDMYSRIFNVPSNAPSGSYEWALAIWSGAPGNTNQYSTTGWKSGLEVSVSQPSDLQLDVQIVSPPSPQDRSTVALLPITFEVRIMYEGQPISGSTVVFYYNDGSEIAESESGHDGCVTVTGLSTLAQGSTIEWWAAATKAGYPDGRSSTWEFTYQPSGTIKNARIVKLETNRIPAIASTRSLHILRTAEEYAQHGVIPPHWTYYLRSGDVYLEGVYAYVTIENPTDREFSGKISYELVNPDGKAIFSESIPFGLLDFLRLESGSTATVKVLIRIREKMELNDGVYQVNFDLKEKEGLVDLKTVDQKTTSLTIVDPTEPSVEYPGKALGHIFYFFKAPEEKELPWWAPALSIINFVILMVTGDSVDILDMAVASEEAKLEPSPWLGTAHVEVDERVAEGDIKPIVIRWWNVKRIYEIAAGPSIDVRQIFANYDRAVVVVKLPDNIEIVDDGGADIVQEGDGWSIVWIEENVDKRIDPAGTYMYSQGEGDLLLNEPSGQHSVKIRSLDSSERRIGITVVVTLMLGPFKEEFGTDDFLIYDYSRWQLDPDSVYWGTVGTDQAEREIDLPSRAIPYKEVIASEERLLVTLDAYFSDAPSPYTDNRVPTEEDILRMLDEYFGD